MTSEREYQRIITRGETIIYENNKYYLVRRESIKSDDIYPKKDWTLREVLLDIGEKADNL
jgi:hypothetical protein